MNYPLVVVTLACIHHKRKTGTFVFIMFVFVSHLFYSVLFSCSPIKFYGQAGIFLMTTKSFLNGSLLIGSHAATEDEEGRHN